MGTEINLHHIILLQHRFIASIWSIVGCTMIYAKPGWKSHSTFDVISFFQTLMPRQRSNAVLDSFSDLRQRLTRFDVPLRPLPDLSVYLRALPVFIQEVVVHSIQMALLLVGSAVAVLILILANLALGILTIWK